MLGKLSFRPLTLSKDSTSPLVPGKGYFFLHSIDTLVFLNPVPVKGEKRLSYNLAAFRVSQSVRHIVATAKFCAMGSLFLSVDEDRIVTVVRAVAEIQSRCTPLS